MNGLKGKTVTTPDGKVGVVTAIHSTRFGTLASINNDNQTAWPVGSLKVVQDVP